MRTSLSLQVVTNFQEPLDKPLLGAYGACPHNEGGAGACF